MDRLNIPKVGDKITAKWANEIVSQIRRQQLVPGPGYRLKTTSNGTVITFDSKKGGGGSSVVGLTDSVYIAQCIGEPYSDGSIPVDLYQDEFSVPVVRNVLVFRPDLTHFSRIDVGTRFMVHAMVVHTNVGGDAL